MWLNRPVETCEGGADKPGGTIVQTRTGYYMRKFMGRYEMLNPPYQNELHYYIVLRYAEVLLNYAEALNEYLGPVTEVYEALEAIRERAGLVPFTLPVRSEEHTSELQSLMRISYAVFCLKKKIRLHITHTDNN